MTPNRLFDPINDPERLDKFGDDLQAFLDQAFAANPDSPADAAYIDGVYVELTTP